MPRRLTVEAPYETPNTPKKKQKSTQVPSLSHDNVHKADSTGTAIIGKSSPIDRNPKHEKSTDSDVILSSSSSPALPSLELSSPILELSSVIIHPFIEEGFIGYSHLKIDEASQKNPQQLLLSWITLFERK
jgi:hypothetical protein